MEGDEVGGGRDSGVVPDRESASRALNLQSHLIDCECNCDQKICHCPTPTLDPRLDE